MRERGRGEMMSKFSAKKNVNAKWCHAKKKCPSPASCPSKWAQGGVNDVCECE